MGYVFEFKEARVFENLINEPRYRSEADRETNLMLSMLGPVRAESVLEIGCGTGDRLTPLVELGVDVTGLDPSPYMLDISFKYIF